MTGALIGRDGHTGERLCGGREREREKERASSVYRPWDIGDFPKLGKRPGTDAASYPLGRNGPC